MDQDEPWKDRYSDLRHQERADKVFFWCSQTEAHYHKAWKQNKKLIFFFFFFFVTTKSFYFTWL